MNNFKLKKIDDIEFVDEYPKVREPLRLFENNITESDKLIELLKKEYK